MSILRIAASPADVPDGGYFFNEAQGFDFTRVSGAFEMEGNKGNNLSIRHDPALGSVTWYHMRCHINSFYLSGGTVARIQDTAQNTIAELDQGYQGPFELHLFGDTFPQSPGFWLAESTHYSFDFKVEHSPTEITVSWYVNGGLIHKLTVANATANRLKPASISFTSLNQRAKSRFSEIIIADEDTRGMRLREMRPTSLGTFQEWDGGIGALRDYDLATGLSTDTADRRASFGVTNLKYISDGDVINRVVAQTYAQRGETGIARFNHFFRFGDGVVTDSATNHNLDEYGQYFMEEFLLNPRTGAGWTPADLRGIQTGVQSRA